MAETKPRATGWMAFPVYTRVTLLGLLLPILVLLVYFVLTLVQGEVEPLILIFAVPTLAVAGLVWRFGRWALIVAAVWAFLLFALNVPFIVPSLKYVNSFFDFGLTVPLLAGLLLALVGGTVAFLQQRKGAARAVASSGERAVFLGITVVVVGLMALSGVLHLTGRATVSEAARAGATSVDMWHTEFKPTQLQAKAGQPIKLVVKNSDPFVHTFTVPELAVSYTVLGGSERLVELTLARAGEFEYQCVVAGHEDMKGKLVATQ